jgi:hypothetical protein
VKMPCGCMGCCFGHLKVGPLTGIKQRVKGGASGRHRGTSQRMGERVYIRNT